MIQIQCTGKALKEFNVKSGVSSEMDNIYNWHLNLFFIRDIKCVYLINDETFYGFVIYDIQNFENCIYSEMKKMLLNSGLSLEKTNKYLNKKIIYTKATNRKIIARMNSVIKKVIYNIERGEENIEFINKMLGEFNTIDGKNSKECFFKKLNFNIL